VLLIALQEPADAAFPGENGRIVFADGSSSGLKLIRPDGSGMTTLVKGCCYAPEATPAMSPGGTRVAYASGYGRDQEIRTINIRTRTVRRITNNEVRDSNPAWSPDGARVAFERERRTVDGAKDTDIYVARTDGTGRTRNLTRTKNAVELAPAWSPDGKEIAFHTAPSVRRSDSCVDVFVMNLATGQRRNLTNDGTERDDCNPNWSPDGASIVFEGGRDIYTMDASDGSDERLLAEGFSDGFDRGFVFESPTYSPSGTKIAYVRLEYDISGTPHGSMRLSTMNASDGSNKQVIRSVSWQEGDNKGLYDPDWGVKPSR
jgi:TolB protein